MEDTVTLNHVDIGTNIGKPFQVILFNDELHNQIEVAQQIQKAISCSVDRAVAIMLEAHQTGRAVVYIGGLERCEHIAAVLEEIRLGTKIEPV